MIEPRHRRPASCNPWSEVPQMAPSSRGGWPKNVRFIIRGPLRSTASQQTKAHSHTCVLRLTKLIHSQKHRDNDLARTAHATRSFSTPRGRRHFERATGCALHCRSTYYMQAHIFCRAAQPRAARIIRKSFAAPACLSRRRPSSSTALAAGAS